MNKGPHRWSRGEGARIGALACSAVTLFLLAGRARASDVDVTLVDTPGCCCVRGSFTAPVSRTIAWGVLADYDSIGKFVRSVRSSRMERHPDGRLLLRQDAVGGVFLFHRRMHVLLEIQEDRGKRIGFRDILGKDFKRYAGEWRIASDSLGTRVVYEVDAEPQGAVARALCRGRLRSAARDLLAEVRAEMLRRADRAR